jgi:hypothetical protein
VCVVAKQHNSLVLFNAFMQRVFRNQQKNEKREITSDCLAFNTRSAWLMPYRLLLSYILIITSHPIYLSLTRSFSPLVAVMSCVCARACLPPPPLPFLFYEIFPFCDVFLKENTLRERKFSLSRSTSFFSPHTRFLSVIITLLSPPVRRSWPVLTPIKSEYFVCYIRTHCLSSQPPHSSIGATLPPPSPSSPPLQTINATHTATYLHTLCASLHHHTNINTAPLTQQYSSLSRVQTR